MGVGGYGGALYQLLQFYTYFPYILFDFLHPPPKKKVGGGGQLHTQFFTLKFKKNLKVPLPQCYVPVVESSTVYYFFYRA